jgi:hypothetical protein
MIVGILVGSYSSIFNAAQLLVVMTNWRERRLGVRRAAGRQVREMAERGAPIRRARPVAPRPLAPIPVPAAPVEEKFEEEAEPEAPAEAATEQGRVPRGARRKLKAARKRKRRF